MLLFELPFIGAVSPNAIVDFVVVTIIMLIVLRALKGSAALNIIFAIALCFGLNVLANKFKLPILQTLFRLIVSSGLIGVIIIFQPEIRKFLIKIGKYSPLGKNSIIQKIFKTENNNIYAIDNDTIEQISKCIVYCVANKLGMLIVLIPSKETDYISDSGVAINSNVNSKLLEAIFEKQSPLHDGAVVIHNDTIIAARVVLQINEDSNLPVRLGLRHRAAVGTTEHTNWMALIVSEEKNTISYAYEGKLYENQTLDQIKAKMFNVVIGN